MAQLAVDIVIAATPEQVWRDISDIATHVEWMADARSIEFVSAQTSGIGTEFDCTTQIGPLRTVDRMEITEWDPPRTMGVRHSGVVRGEGRFTLRPVGRAHTRFEWREELEFPLAFGGRLGATVASPVLRYVWRRNLTALARRFQ